MSSSPLPAVDVADELRTAVSHHQSGNLVHAEAHYKKILSQYPRHPDALHLLGVIEHQRGKSQAAVLLIKQAIRYAPGNPLYHNNLGAALREMGAQDEAVKCYQKALQLQPDYAEAAYNLGSVLLIMGDFSEAVAWYEKAVQIKPTYVDAYANLAAGYNNLNRPDDALICCQKALKLNPQCAVALNNMGNALMTRGQWREAIACYRQSIRVEPQNPEAHCNLGNAYHDLGRPGEALTCYRSALKLNPEYGEAYNNMGVVLREQGRTHEAHFCYQKAMYLKPDAPEAYLNLGNVLKDQQKLDDAVAMYQRAIDRKPQLTDAYVNLGVVLEEQGRSEQAVSSYRKALEIDPEHAKAYSHLVHQLQQVCAWQELAGFNPKLDELTEKAFREGKKPAEMPFLNLTRHWDPSLNHRVAKAWSDEICGRIAGIPQYYPMGMHADDNQKSKDSCLTIGYLSNNFKNHPTAHLVQGMFHHHDRKQFRVFCYSYGEDDRSSYREKIKAACDQFIDIRTFSHMAAAKRIYDDRVDILVDLVGYMKANRLCIAALRPAPVQVRWLGLAGTTGADFIDYLIADEIVSPAEQSPFYSETLVFMPHCYQINDNTQAIRDHRPNRAEYGLPADRFVFCAFSTHYKFDPVMFACWMRILDQVPGSVLWLLGGNQMVETNLMQAAEYGGVSADRILFAPKIPREDHLKRLQCADLALDTRIVNGAITTSDALWSGVPVVTLQGRHFASRMASSILAAANLSELVVHSLDGYEALAFRLATQPSELNSIRERLVRDRLTVPLFDTAGFVSQLENAYLKMHEFYQSGSCPQTFRVGGCLPDAV